ncbi:MAG TPA: NAD(P)-dependent oxidoreductase [Aggregatilineales bacterium]|nr:NAD(P)-dependent oxidoreductase [Anaerolineales bacterium]HRE49758.1 NAD(P)-dependent oxidoreductase [Aggregatilineales bacterium]
MKILLAGATGVVGRNLLPLLSAAGYEVTGTTRRPDKQAQIAALGGQPLVMDALDRDRVFAALETIRPDIVFHQLTDLAGRDFSANVRLRVEGTRHLVDAARAVGVKRMIAQSISWVCVAGESPACEIDPLDLDAPQPRRETILGVQALEQAVAEMPIGVVLRYGLLYGAGTWYDRDSLMTEQIRRGELTATDAVSSFLHVEDAARAALSAIDWPAGVYHIVDDEPAAGTQWLPVYARLVNAPPPLTRLGRQGWKRGESNAKARAVGWSPHYRSWREGFVHVLA